MKCGSIGRIGIYIFIGAYSNSGNAISLLVCGASGSWLIVVIDNINVHSLTAVASVAAEVIYDIVAHVHTLIKLSGGTRAKARGTAAMVGNALGFDKRILNNNAAYMDGWINDLREEPKFIVSVMADVNKASKMILEKIDEQKIALGERPILSSNMSKEDLQANIAKQAWQQPHDIALQAKFDSASRYKPMDGGYAVRATFEGQDLGMKPISKITGIRYEMMPTGALKDQMLHDTVARKFAGEVREIREQKQQNKESNGLTL